MSDFREYAFVSLGANLPSRFGDPAATLKAATTRLQGLSAEPLLLSSLWASAPVDCPPDSPTYVNAVTGLLPAPGVDARSFLHELQAIENAFGRTRSGVLNEARVLDLDLIVFGNEQCNDAELVLPHPRAALRRFVLEPLAELCGPDWVLPGTSLRLAEHLAALEGQPISRLP